MPEAPAAQADIIEVENEMIGDLSLNKEPDFTMTINDLILQTWRPGRNDYKHVTVGTIKMGRRPSTSFAIRRNSTAAASSPIDCATRAHRLVSRPGASRANGYPRCFFRLYTTCIHAMYAWAPRQGGPDLDAVAASARRASPTVSRPVCEERWCVAPHRRQGSRRI
jgi:hypothetical protein